MNIETVNELITSLESGGELSIREQKFLKLAKEFNQLAAENVRLAAENKMAVDAVTVFSNVTHDVTEIICDELGHDRVAEIVAAYNDLGNMPSTDRIVAGIKADGVEEFAAKLRIPGDDQFFDALAKGVAIAADDFAKQLREGADK
ncbi:TPA: hypothetical protein ACWL76_003991 [Klebsiella michiganensis]